MDNTVYILGAGVNQEIFAQNHISPPLIDNFFEIAFKVHDRFGDYDDRLEDVYKYINKYWRKSKKDLQNEKFDLEECLTLLQLQINEATEKGDDVVYDELYKIQIRLLSFFYEVLDEFKHYIEESSTFLKFGKILYDQKPNIITFNYDDFIFKVIEKRRNLYFIRNELFQIYGKPEQSDFIKMKILDKLLELDVIDLHFIQDFPYLHKYHDDIERDFRELDEDIEQNKANLKNLQIDCGKKDRICIDGGEQGEIESATKIVSKYTSITGKSNNNLQNIECDKIKRIPIEEISKNKEIQKILSSRDQSGFTRHTNNPLKEGIEL